jgi:hypothetical protein
MIGIMGVVFDGKKLGTRISAICKIKYCIMVRPCKDERGSCVRRSKSRNNSEHTRPIRIKNEDRNIDIMETRTWGQE